MSTLILRRLVPVLLLVVVVCTMATSVPDVSADQVCKKVSGKVTVQQVQDGCASPFGCARGAVKGGIKGTVNLTVTWISPVLPAEHQPPAPGIMFSTGNAVFDTPDGQLWTTDSTVTSLTTGEYAEVITVTGGTGRYENAYGTITATGAQVSATTAAGVYEGEICTR